MEGAHATAASLPPGAQVAGYSLGERIGVGGFGEVYRARHTVIGRQAAIKILHRRYAHDADAVARFIAEARAVNRVSHPGIVEIFDVGTLDDGRPFCVMELLEGQTLREVLAARGRLPLDEALPILRGIAEAVDAAHGAGIAHRDLKPDNVFVLAGGSVKLIDFGLAKLVDGTEATITREGTIFGTPLYMSPEQCRGNASDLRTDTYSFGVLAYQVLTGSLPFTGDALEVALHHVNDAPEPPAKRCAELPARVDDAILAALAKEPADRPATLVAVVEALAGDAALPTVRLGGRARRRSLAWIALGVLAAAAIAATALMLGWRSAATGPPALVLGPGGRAHAAIVGFETASDEEAWRSPLVTEVLTPLLDAGGRLQLLGRQDRSTYLLDLDRRIAPRDGYDRATLAAFARRGPSRYVISGRVERDGGGLRLRVRMQDAVTGDTVAVVQRRVEGDDLAGVVAAAAIELRRRLGLPPLDAVDVAASARMLPAAPARVAYGKALVALLSYRTPAALTELDRVVELDPAFAPGVVAAQLAGVAAAGRVAQLDVMKAAAERAQELPIRARLEIEREWRRMARDRDAAVDVSRRLVELLPGDFEAIVGLAGDLGEAGRHDEAAEVLEAAKRLPPPFGEDPSIHYGEMELAWARRDLPAALAAARRGVQRCRATQWRTMLARFLSSEGQVLATMMRTDEAIPVLTEATRLLGELGIMEVRPFFALKEVYFARTELSAARRVLQEIHALRMAHAPPSERPLMEAFHAYDLASIDHGAGDFVRAEHGCTRAWLLYLAAGVPYGNRLSEVPRECLAHARAMIRGEARPEVARARAAVARARAKRGDALINSLGELALALREAGQHAEAEARYEERASLLDAQDRRRDSAWTRMAIAEVILASGDPRRSRQAAERAIEDFRASAGTLGETYARHVIALAHLDEGDLEAARATIEPHVAWVSALEHVTKRIEMQATAATVLGWSGTAADSARALALADRALADALASGGYEQQNHARYARGMVLRQAGRGAEARVELQEVERRARAIGAGELARRARTGWTTPGER